MAHKESGRQACPDCGRPVSTYVTWDFQKGHDVVLFRPHKLHGQWCGPREAPDQSAAAEASDGPAG